MKMSVKLFLVLLYFLASSFAYHQNPYEVLGVKPTSPFPEIRDAYKHLVKIWHPDKNDHTNKQEAEDKFRKINEAYQELLKIYKQPVSTKTSVFKHFNEYSYDSAIDYLNQMSITFVQYQYIYVPKSHHAPVLFFIYADWCLLCFENVPTWQQLRSTLEPLRVQLKTVHHLREPTLARKLNYHSVPSLVVLIDGKPFIYKEGFNYYRILDFIKQRLPFPLISNIQNNLDDFLSSSKLDNRIRALLSQDSSSIRLPYLLIAYSYRTWVNFGYIVNKTVPKNFDTIHLFNEYYDKPLTTLQISKFDQNFDLVFESLDKHRFLLMPRLSSNDFFDSLCSLSSSSLRKICLVLLIPKKNNDISVRAVDEFRKFSLDFKQVIIPKNSQLRFTYIYIDYQREFLSNFLELQNRTHIKPYDILALVRFDTNKSLIKYTWFKNVWLVDAENFVDIKFDFYEFIDELLTFKKNFTSSAVLVKNFYNENFMTISNKVANYLLYLWLTFTNELTTEHILITLSVAGSVMFILVIAYVMHYLAEIEEKKVNEKLNKTPKKTTNKSSSASTQNAHQTQELKLHELRIEKYNGLVRLLKPGCRTIILIVDLQSRMQLIPQFHKIVWPYRKNKCLMFAHMAIERGLGWYRDLLQLALPEKCDLKINPRNCVGTVLSLNGYRKYFCMFHAKHPETSHNEKKFLRLRNIRIHDIEKGTNAGFDSDYDSDSDDNGKHSGSDVLMETELLKGLPNWLDRLFEGTTQRYFVNYWPEFSVK